MVITWRKLCNYLYQWYCLGCIHCAHVFFPIIVFTVRHNKSWLTSVKHIIIQVVVDCGKIRKLIFNGFHVWCCFFLFLWFVDKQEEFEYWPRKRWTGNHITYYIKLNFTLNSKCNKIFSPIFMFFGCSFVYLRVEKVSVDTLKMYLIYYRQ